MRRHADKRVRAIQKRRTAVPSTAIALAIVLAFHNAGPTLHALEPPDNDAVQSAEQKKAAKVKVEVTRRGVGAIARVRVKLRDKHELKGHITQIDEDSFEVLVDQDGLDPQSVQSRLITIPYAEVEKIRGPRSRVASIAIGVGMTVAALAALAMIAYAEVHKHDHCY
jgi:small nuclear ribonucleoprotein (snRNP)-like protein